MSFYRDEVARSAQLAACDVALRAWPDVGYRACLEHDLDHEVRLSRGRLRGFLDHLARDWAATGSLDGSWKSASGAWNLGTAWSEPRADPAFPLGQARRPAGDRARHADRHGLDPAHAAARLPGPAALATLRLGWGDPVWGGFDPADPSRHPAEGRGRARLMDLLGLPYDPAVPSTGYPRSARVVALRFEVAATHVPTVADAGWNNPWWIPAPSKGAFGRARDVAGVAPADLARGPRRPGLAELVVGNADARSAVRKDPVDARFVREVA